MVTLHHFTSPQWFARQGGFTSDDAPELFASFVAKVAARLGDRVSLWCTINEPGVLIAGTHLGAFMPPGIVSRKLAMSCYRGLVRAHERAYEVLHSTCTKKPLVGFAHNMIDFVPARAWHPLDQLLSAVAWRLYNRAWLDATKSDFIGVNYYTRGYVSWGCDREAEYHGSNPPFSISFKRGKEPTSDLGWSIHPEGLERILRFVSRYRRPIYITENGIADATDRLRADYLKAHVAAAFAAGIELRGYYHWSLIDNFEWHKGFGPRFGLFEVDYQTLRRTPRASAEVFRQLISADRARRHPQA